MKLDSKKIFDLSLKFTGMFFVLTKENDSFLDCLLALIYSAETVCNVAVKLNAVNQEEINSIKEKLSLASQGDIEENMKKIGPIIQKLRQQNWELKDDGNE